MNTSPPNAGEAKASTATTDPPQDRKSKSQPSRRLPTDRIKFQKQLDIVRAYGIRSQNGSRTTNYKEVADDVAIHPNTASLMVGFLVDNGFLDRIGSETMPSRPVLDFVQAYNWSPDSASRKLAPLIKKSWFGEILLRKLAFRALQEDDAVSELASFIGADREHKPQIVMLIDYAVASGLVKREGSQLSLGDEALGVGAFQSPEAEPKKITAEEPKITNQQQGGVATGFMTTEGAVQFHVDIRVTMKEMATWSPDRITAFFGGLAQVLAAKKGAEQI
jgi:hypothetical protein